MNAETKEKLKEANLDLTDEDLAGPEAEIVKRLAEKMKRSEEDIRGWIDSVAFTKGKAS